MRHLIIFLIADFFIMVSPLGYAADGTVGTLQNDVTALQRLVRSLQGTVQDLQKTVQNQNEVIERQNLRLNGLEAGKPAVQTAPVKTPLNVKGLSQGFNPDIGVVGTFQAHLTEESEDAEGKDTLVLKEVELNLAQYVDPYSRLDVILALNDGLEEQNIDVEEAYYSHWGLPWGFQGRLGKFRAKAGKQNMSHLDQLLTTDYPLVIQDFFGEEGMSASGVRLHRDIPNPWDVPVFITGEVFRGNNGESFSGISRRPIFNTHVSGFFDLSDDLNLELGGTWMVGDDRFGVHIFGFDATLNWYLEQGRRVFWQSELFLQQRSNDVAANHDPWGFYTLLDFRFSPKFSTGIRLDYLEPRSVADAHGRSVQISPYLTFWQSEFANFTAQYRHLDPADPDAKSDDALVLEAVFLIGAHSHPVQ